MSTSWRSWFLLFLGFGMWACIPFLQISTIGTDVVPLVTAGTLARSDPGSIYSEVGRGTHDTNATFGTVSCAQYPEGTDCASLVVPFSPPPLAIPFTLILAAIGIMPATFLMRAIGVAALIIGYAAVARRCTSRNREVPLILGASAVVLTPFVSFTLQFGQTSPLLFLAAALGVMATDKRQAATIGRAALLAATVALKAFPLAVIVVAVLQKRWRLLAYTAAFLTAVGALTFLIVPTSVTGSFLRSTQAGASITTTDPFSRGLDGLLNLFVGWKTTGSLYNLSLVVRAGLLVLYWHRRVRHLDHDAQWAYAWLALLAFSPVVWLHYLWLIVAALLHALRTRVAAGVNGHRDPVLLVLPATCAALSVAGLVDAPTSVLIVYCAGLLLGALVGVPLLARPTPPSAAVNNET